MTVRWMIAVGALGLLACPAAAQTTAPAGWPGRPEALPGALNWALVVTVLAVAPAIALLATCFTRVAVVLGLLRQALTSQQVPPNQVLWGLALLITVVVMSPVLRTVHSDALEPYLAGRLDARGALEAAQPHVRQFMIRQIESAGNGRDVFLFLDPQTRRRPEVAWRDVPTPSLIAGYCLSELKVAFLIGVQIFLPLVAVDLLVATVLTSMGMLMLPPVLISLPLKLLLFVLADGWHLVVGTLLGSLGYA